MEQRSAADGWSRVVVGSLVGNLPELLAHAIGVEETRILIIEPTVGGRYLQALCAKGEVHIEASSNAFLEGEDELDADDELWLLAAGFEPPEASCPNWSWHGSGPASAFDAAGRLAAGLASLLGLGSGDAAWIRQFEGAPC